MSAAFAAAKLAIALWFGQLALSALDRRRVTLAWQIALAVATMAVSWWAVRSSGVPGWWSPAWVTSSLLAAAALLDSMRRWLSSPSPGEIPQAAPLRPASQRIHDWIAVVGLVVTAVAGSVALRAQLPASEPLARWAAVVQMLACAGLLGIVLAATFELTIGATGATLPGLNWRRLSRAAALCLLVQLVISTLIIALRRDAATPAQSLTPIVFALGMAIGGYIVWAIPRRVVTLAAKGQMEGQASLALAGWLAVICLAVACGLPPAWPWNLVGTASLSQGAVSHRGDAESAEENQPSAQCALRHLRS